MSDATESTEPGTTGRKGRRATSDGDDGAGTKGAPEGTGQPGPDEHGKRSGPEEGDGTDGGTDDGGLSNWVFVERTPTADEVLALLGTLPDVWGIRVAAFIDYVQPLPQRAKIRALDGTPVKGPDGKDTYRTEYRLYMSVAGREMMMVAAQEINDWRVDYVPSDYMRIEENKGAAIYRETCVIYERAGAAEDGTFQFIQLGSKPGTAKFRGVDRPAEVAETAARGRSIAAWGFGVLPGSGVASLEEMSGVPAGPVDEPPPGRRQEKEEPKSKEDLVKEVLLLAEEARQLRDEDEFKMRERLADYIRGLGVEIAVQNEDQKVVNFDWKGVSPAQLRLTRGQLQKSLVTLRGQETQV